MTLADMIVRLSGGSAGYVTREFPADRAQIDIGSYHADDSAFRAASGWTPETDLWRMASAAPSTGTKTGLADYL